MSLLVMVILLITIVSIGILLLVVLFSIRQTNNLLLGDT
jgi:hypothetical protein